jgi:hypothetical protein
MSIFEQIIILTKQNSYLNKILQFIVHRTLNFVMVQVIFIYLTEQQEKLAKFVIDVWARL